MQSPVLTWLRGSVRIRIVVGKKREGDAARSSIESFLNKALSDNLSIWDIRVLSEGAAECSILLRDFFRLRVPMRRTGCVARIEARSGLPFALGKLARRKLFISGILMFLVALYLLSSLLWQVSVVGNNKIPTHVILEAAAKQGIHRFQWKFMLDRPAELSRNLQTALPDAAWIGVEMEGTHLTIRVVEYSQPDAKPLASPRNLIAAKNAVISQIWAEKGRPLVKQNAYVRKGDVLISGYIGDEQHGQVVVAQGTIKGLVWYKSSIESPLIRYQNVQTGDSKQRGYLVIGSRALQLTGYGDVPFEQHETIVTRSALQWRNWTLPIGWMSEKLMDVKRVEQSLTTVQAKEIGLARAREELLKQAGPDARIVSEKILHEGTESGKVYMEVHFEVEESIAQEQPIVTQGE